MSGVEGKVDVLARSSERPKRAGSRHETTIAHFLHIRRVGVRRDSERSGDLAIWQ